MNPPIPTPTPSIEPPLDRATMETLYAVFNKSALEDQRIFYQRTVRRSRLAATQVNRWRAAFAWITGLAAALSGLVVTLTPPVCLDPAQAYNAGCGWVLPTVGFLLVLAVVAPALGGAFGTLADLFQWDRLIKIYELALDNLEVADAKSPFAEMDNVMYYASLKAFAEGALSVMRDETAQWGQIIRTPEAIDKYIHDERAKLDKTIDTLPEPAQRALRAELDAAITRMQENYRQQMDELAARFARDAGDTPAPPTPPAPAG